MFKWLIEKLYPRGVPRIASSTARSQSDADTAIRNAKAAKTIVDQRAEKVHQAVGELRNQGQVNHFGELIEKTMRGTG